MQPYGAFVKNVKSNSLLEPMIMVSSSGDEAKLSVVLTLAEIFKSDVHSVLSEYDIMVFPMAHRAPDVNEVSGQRI